MPSTSSNFICGQISMPTQWFEMDAMERRTFTLYCDKKTETFSVDSATRLREFWIRCIRPTYYSPSSPNRPLNLHIRLNMLINWFDIVPVKSTILKPGL